MVFGGAIKFIRRQTVSSDMTYLSRRAATSLSVRMRSVLPACGTFFAS